MKKLIIMLFIISLVLIFGCSQEKNIEKDSKPEETVKSTGTIREIFITAKQFEFSPNPINVNKGDRVVLHIKSLDVTHGFRIPEYNIDKPINPGETTDIEFVADKPGTFTIYCSVFCGEGHPKMRAQLIVE